jgi:ABC-2 type transport system ATP-binding protein
MNVILSSHVLPDVESTCHHVLVLDRGVVAAQGPLDAVRGRARRAYDVRIKGSREEFVAALARSGIECDSGGDEGIRVFLPEGQESRALFRIAVQQGAQIRHLRPSVSTLEDAFTRAVGERTAS